MTDLDVLAAAANLPQWAMVGPINGRHMDVVRPGQYWAIRDAEPLLRAAVAERDRLRAALEEVGRIASHHRSHQRLEHCMPEEIVAELYDVLAALHREDGT